MYAINAPTGPAMATAVPLPINKPVPIVPPEYDYQLVSNLQVFQLAMDGIWGLTDGNHLQMPASQPAL